MSLDLIQQNINIILETIDVYNNLLRQREEAENKKTIEKINKKLAEVKAYALKVSNQITDLIKEEKENA